MVTKQVRKWHKTGTIVECIFVKTAGDLCQFYLLTTKPHTPENKQEFTAIFRPCRCTSINKSSKSEENLETIPSIYCAQELA